MNPHNLARRPCAISATPLLLGGCQQVPFDDLDRGSLTAPSIAARGIRDGAMLLPKMQRATAHPIRSARDSTRFLAGQPRVIEGEL